MRIIPILFMAGCVAQTTTPEVMSDTDTDTDTGEIALEDGPLSPAPIDLAAPPQVEMATFALG